MMPRLTPNLLTFDYQQP